MGKTPRGLSGSHLPFSWLVPGSDCHFTYEHEGTWSPQAEMLEEALEAPGQARGKAIGIASQWLSLCPRPTWEGMACFGSYTQPGECLWDGGRDCAHLKLWMSYLSQKPLPSRLAKASSHLVCS